MLYVVEAGRTLVALAPKDAATVQALGNHLRIRREADPVNQRLRVLAAEALGRIGPDAVAELSALKFALKDDDVLLRTCAAAALGRIGPAARDATVDLQMVNERDPFPHVRTVAAEALQRVGAGK